jgi:urea transport system substrate-binding protein
MKACPTHEQLEHFLQARLSDFDRQAVDAHIQTCDSCQETVSILRARSGTLNLNLNSVVRDIANVPPELANHPRYRILELIDVGGMGAVFKGEHRLLERLVVLKVIRKELLGNSEQVQRFLREAKLAASLLHPNIVTLFEAEQTGEVHFLVMEYLEGIDLARLIKSRGPLPVGEACEWVRQAALGLQYIHERGLIHRDIKPSNLLLVGGKQIKILDLGLATLQSEAKEGNRITQFGQLLGTVEYMAPEQWEASHDVDIRADIYGLGCTLYDLLTGKPPFHTSQHSTLMKQMMAHALAPIPPIREQRPDVPEPVATILSRMLAKSPDDRFATPGDVAAALEPFATAVSPTPPPGSVTLPSGTTPPSLILPRGPLRNVAIGAGLAVSVFLTILLVLLLGWFFTSRSVRSGPTFVGPPVKVGILHSRTGTMAISERPVIDATLFAIEEVNEQGGVLGRMVEAVVEDGASDWPTFRKKAEKLITQDRVCTVFGCWTSASRKTVRPVFEKYDNLLFYPLQYEGLESSPNIVYTGAAPNQQIIPAVKWSCTFLKKKRLFLVGSDYVFPHAANAIIRDQATELGAEVVGEKYLLLGSSDTEDIVKEIQASKPDVILNTINGDSNVSFFRALRTAGITSEKVPTISFSISEEELGSLNINDIKGDYAAWNYFQSIEEPVNQEFVRRFRERFGRGRVLSDPMEAAYFGVHLWAKAVRQAETDEPPAIRKSIGGQSFDAPEGKVRIDEQTQHTSKYIRIGRITETGRFEVVYTSESPLRPAPYPGTRSPAMWESFLSDLHLRWGGKWANPGR